MKTGRILLIIIAALSFAAPTISAQACGDVNNDGATNVADLVQTFNYIDGPPDPLYNTAAGDCDDKAGVTISDALRLANNVFLAIPLECNISSTYSFAPAPNDTIFIPRMLGIPDGTSEVNLLVYGSFSSPAGGLYVPIMHYGTGSNSAFQFYGAAGADFDMINAGDPGGDTTVLWAVDMVNRGDYNGNQNLFMLKYQRNSAGPGDVAPEAFDRTTDWQIAIERGGDLFRPVIVYYDAADVALAIVPGQLLFNAAPDSMSHDTTWVSFIASGAPLGIGFSITRSDTWIILDDYNGILPWPSYTTPASVPISADATGFGVMDYQGVIHVYYKGFNGWGQPIDSIMITMSVNSDPGPQYPPGDLNCDGQVDIGDIVFLVNFLFINGPAPAFCQ